MEISETFLVNKEDVLKREYNLWVGISFGNKWFNEKNIKEIIKFGLEYTRDSLLILVPGRLYATNLRYFEDFRRSEALKIAFSNEDNFIEDIKRIISDFDEEDRKKIVIANYDDIITPQFAKQREVLMREFSKQDEFYNLVLEISKEIFELRGRTISKDRLEAVSLFVLQELPLFLDGVVKNNNFFVYNVVLYPGMGKLDELVNKILTIENFSTLREKLNIKNKSGIVSVK